MWLYKDAYTFTLFFMDFFKFNKKIHTMVLFFMAVFKLNISLKIYSGLGALVKAIVETIMYY